MVENNQTVGPNTDNWVFLQTLPPALKRNVQVDWYVDATIHLLKGLGEDAMDLMADWTKKYSKHTPVCRQAIQLHIFTSALVAKGSSFWWKKCKHHWRMGV